MASFNEKYLYGNSESDDGAMDDLIPEKVRFREKEDNPDKGMLVDDSATPLTSWKDKLLGQSSKLVDLGKDGDETDDIELPEDDVLISSLHGSSSIEFSKHIRQILFRDMENTVVLKLLGHNIGYTALLNKIYSLWKPTRSLHLLDIENDYFLVKFHNKIDCDRALSEGPWIIFKQYLII